MVLFKHNLPHPTQPHLMRSEFLETLYIIEQGVVLSCRFAEWKVWRAPGVLRMVMCHVSSSGSVCSSMEQSISQL